MIRIFKRELILISILLLVTGALVALLIAGCDLTAAEKERRRVVLQQQSDIYLRRAQQYQAAQEQIVWFLETEEDISIRGRLLEAVATLESKRVHYRQLSRNCQAEIERL